MLLPFALKEKPYGKSAYENANQSSLSPTSCDRNWDGIVKIIKQQSLCCCCSYRNINPSNFDFPQCFIYLFETFHTVKATASGITMPRGVQTETVLRNESFSQLWHSRVVFYALPFIAWHYFNFFVFSLWFSNRYGGHKEGILHGLLLSVDFRFVVLSYELADRLYMAACP